MTKKELFWDKVSKMTKKQMIELIIKCEGLQGGINSTSKTTTDKDRTDNKINKKLKNTFGFQAYPLYNINVRHE